MSRLDHPAAAIGAYLRTLMLAKTMRSRAAILSHQQRANEPLLRFARSRTGFYRDLPAGATAVPVVDKAIQQDNFARFNVPAISRDEIRATLAAGEERIGRFFVGQSTGTSGRKGVYLISARERMMWLGTIVAKTIPAAMVRSTRVAIALPAFSALYASASIGSRVRLAFFDVAAGFSTWQDRFRSFAPGVIVAPPAILRQMAEADLIGDAEPFSAAETLDPIDRSVVERATGRPLREIYMATEGLLGVSCRQGTMHLAEDVMQFEWEGAPDGRLANPIITDLVRRVQPMIRYRMNDLLELTDRPCPCGSPLQAVARIHGRLDDAFEFDHRGTGVTVTPDVLRNAVVGAHDAIDDFRLVQHPDASISIALKADVPDEAHLAARHAIAELLAQFGTTTRITSLRGLPARSDRKLRRVERERH